MLLRRPHHTTHQTIHYISCCVLHTTLHTRLYTTSAIVFSTPHTLNTSTLMPPTSHNTLHITQHNTLHTTLLTVSTLIPPTPHQPLCRPHYTTQHLNPYAAHITQRTTQHYIPHRTTQHINPYAATPHINPCATPHLVCSRSPAYMCAHISTMIRKFAITQQLLRLQWSTITSLYHLSCYGIQRIGIEFYRIFISMTRQAK